MSPTARTMKWLKENGYTAEVVERWNSFAHIRQDLFNCIDVVALHRGKVGCIGIQVTTKHNMTARITKALAEPKILEWIACGNSFVVHGWAKQGERGKRKTWQLTAYPVNP